MKNIIGKDHTTYAAIKSPQLSVNQKSATMKTNMTKGLIESQQKQMYQKGMISNKDNLNTILETQQLSTHLKHRMYFSNQQASSNNNSKNNNESSEQKDNHTDSEQRIQVYQNYLDIELSDGEQEKINSMEQKIVGSNIKKTVDLQSDDELLDEEVIDNTDFQRKKPNSVAAVLGREGGMMKKNQSSQINNAIETQKKSFQMTQINTQQQPFLGSTVPSNQAPQILRDLHIQSPLAFQNSLAQGFKTPTTEILGIDLINPTSQTTKGVYSKQLQLIPVSELNMVPKRNSGLLANHQIHHSSRNDELRPTNTNKTIKSQQTTQSGLAIIKSGAGPFENTLNFKNSNEISKTSIQALNAKSTLGFSVNANNLLINQNSMQRQLESPTTLASSQIMFAGGQINKKSTKKGKKNNIQGKEKKAIIKQPTTTKQQNSSSFMKNYQSVPHITQPQQKSSIQQLSTQQQQLSRHNVEMNAIQEQNYQTIYGLPQARSAQGFAHTQSIFDSKYQQSNVSNEALKSGDLKSELSCLLKKGTAGKSGKINNLKSSYLQQNAPSSNINNNSIGSSTLTGQNARPTPKSSFTQVIHITQNEQVGTFNQKTQDILISHLSEKSREIAALKQENKELQEKLFQAEKELILMAAMTSQNMTSSKEQLIKQQKHLKTMSLHDNVTALGQIKCSPSKIEQQFAASSNIREDFYKTNLTASDKKLAPTGKNALKKLSLQESNGNLLSPSNRIIVNYDDQSDYSGVKNADSAKTLLHEKKKSFDLTGTAGMNNNNPALIMNSGKIESIFRVMSPTANFNRINNHNRLIQSSQQLLDSRRSTNHKFQSESFQSVQDRYGTQDYTNIERDLGNIMQKVNKVLRSYQKREQLLIQKINLLQQSNNF